MPGLCLIKLIKISKSMSTIKLSIQKIIQFKQSVGTVGNMSVKQK